MCKCAGARAARAVKEAVRTAEIVCLLCPHSGGAEGRACRLDGRQLVHVTLNRSCPKGKHPDADGRVRWLGVLWRGVPWPLRWRLPKGVKPPGCGCLDALKRLSERCLSGCQRLIGFCQRRRRSA